MENLKKTLFPLIIKKSNTSVTENIQHIAEDFNNFFANVGKNTFDNPALTTAPPTLA